MTSSPLTLRALIAGVGGARVDGDAAADVAIAEVRDDSRQVGRGDLFVAVPGRTVDGGKFVGDAIARGAAAVVIEAASAGTRPAELAAFPGAVVLVPSAKRALGEIAAARHQAAGALTLLAVTGTNGKTTTTYIVEAMLRAAGLSPGVVGTVTYRAAGLRGGARPAPLTTPGALALHELFAEMRDAATTDVVLEASSQALEQGRLDGCSFRVAAMTNLTQDHLDYHGDMGQYFEAKAILFQRLVDRARGVSVTFVDDEAGQQMRKRATGARLGVARARARAAPTSSSRRRSWAPTERARRWRRRWDGCPSNRRWWATTTWPTWRWRSAWRWRAASAPTRSSPARRRSRCRGGSSASPTTVTCCAWSTTRTRPTGWSARSARCGRWRASA
jgi:UDP-N-acetylmuramyl-tripeptide synthetase